MSPIKVTIEPNYKTQFKQLTKTKLNPLRNTTNNLPKGQSLHLMEASLPTQVLNRNSTDQSLLLRILKKKDIRPSKMKVPQPMHPPSQLPRNLRRRTLKLPPNLPRMEVRPPLPEVARVIPMIVPLYLR